MSPGIYLAEEAEEKIKSFSGTLQRPKATEEQERIHCISTKEYYCTEWKKVDFNTVTEIEGKCYRLEETGKPEKKGVATHDSKTYCPMKQKSRGAELTTGINYGTLECYLNLRGL